MATLTLTALIAAVAIAVSTSPAAAQTQADTQEIDVDSAIERAERYLTTLLSVDLDADGFADYDSSDDGVAEVQVEHVDDLAIRPGQNEFTELLRTALNEHTTPSSAAAIAGDCSSILLSFDGNGTLIDSALTVGAGHGGGQAGMAMDLFPQHVTGEAIFTPENPFVVGDKVVVVGQSGYDLNDEGHSTGQEQAWKLSSAEILLGDGRDVAHDVVVSELVVADYARIAGLVEPVGLFPVDASISAQGAVLCQASGWVQFEQGSPLLTNVGIAASGLSALGLLGLFGKARPARVWKKEEEA